jgi:tryptophan synthase alpha chain
MTVSRLDTCFARLADQGRAGFVGYVMAGDPDPATGLAVMRALAAAGADIVELGFPFSDPMADGPAIQAAGRRSLAAGGSLRAALAQVRAFREGDTVTPVVLMGYLNPVEQYGPAAFAADAAAAGVDGLIVVDVPPEEEDALADALEANAVALVRLVAPTTGPARMAHVVRRASGFVYYVSVAGVTGVKAVAAAEAVEAAARVRAASGLPVAVGFGVRQAEEAAAVARGADAVVVGSALVERIADAVARGCPEQAPDAVADLARTLCHAVHTARRTETLA